ncbi:uncharacterized protein LOC143111573 [Alosa pseudoharengus]|uniref:uncharacterized protein LOC143111573 n=1 Tax=Alosa pseudoharengus TaxID=34774 RepID=UPI003F8A5E04
MEKPLIAIFCLLAGRSAVIRCPYDKKYEGHSKYLCRGKCSYGNKDIPIRSAKDSGKYWCAVATALMHVDEYTQVKLNVKKGPPPTPNPACVSSTEHQTVSSSPSFSPPPSNTSQSGNVGETTTSGRETAAEPQEDPVVMVILCVLVLLVMVTVCVLVSALYYRQRRKTQTAACGPSSLQHMGEANDFQMSELLGSIPVTRATVSRPYCLAGAPHRPSVTSLCSTVKPVTQGSDQPTYCNSQEDNVIYSNDISPEETTSPTMHYSCVVNSVNTPSALVQNREGDIIYSEVWLP